MSSIQSQRLLITAEDFNDASAGYLPGVLGISIDDVGHGFVHSRLNVEQRHLAPNGFLHAATVVALADTSCGFGCSRSRPKGAIGFTTIEIKTNFLGTAREGRILCQATMVHGGRMTQVWDAEVTEESTGKSIAVFRCTQMILWPRDQ